MSQAISGRKIIPVAVGIMIRADGRFLLAKRPLGKPYENYWEFPGGKVECGESIHQALSRELREELGIEISQSHAWQVIEHDYPHAFVQLHLCIVRLWQGQPAGLEGQLLHWQEPSLTAEAHVSPLLPATVKILELFLEKPVLP